MVEKSKDSEELDELQKSIDEAAEEATKIKVTMHDDEKSEEPEQSEENSEEESIDLKAEDEAAPDNELEEIAKEEKQDSPEEKFEESEEDEELTQEELEKEFQDDPEMNEVAEEQPEKQAGPAGPYQPVIPESSYGEDEKVETDSEPEVETPTDEEEPETNEQNEAESPENMDEAVDEMLSVEPHEAQAAAAGESDAKKKRSFFGKIKHFFAAWWRNKKARYGTLLALFILFTVTAFVPAMRYGALNLVGVRVNTSLTVVDSQTGLPLENIPVTLAGEEKRSDEEGMVEFMSVKLGDTQLVIDKLGYAVYEKDLVLGLGSNPLGPQPLTATGAQFRFRLVDWLSEKPITEASARSGEDIAQTDAEGRIQITIGELSDETEVTIQADGYRDEVFLVNDLSGDVNSVSLVQGKKHAFVSNRSGDYDLYKIDVDGQNEEVLLGATGEEREIPFVLPHQDRDLVAYISSRDGETNDDGFVLDGLFIIDVASGEVEKVTRSEQLQVIGWAGNKLVYVAVVEGVSAGNSQRSKVFSYDLDTRERVELASANYFNDVKLVNDLVYYSVSSAAVPESRAKLYSTNADGTSNQLVVDTQVWNIIRSNYTTLYFNAIEREWYEQQIGQQPIKLDAEPTNTLHRIYTVSPNQEKSAWVDIRDGRGVLLAYNTKTDEDTTVLTASGLTNPVYWVTDSALIYRVNNSDETADYVLNLDGGVPEKISDVVGNQSRYFY